MNLQQLKKLITAGESENLEFKNSTGQRTAAMKAVCGMLNGLGGFVLFGVTDKGELRGQDINANTMETISAELGRIDPPAFPDIETVTLENGKSVIALRVPGGGGVYTYDGRPYIRTGPTTRVMPREEYERRLMDRMHSTRRWENEPVAKGVSIKDLDEEDIQITLQSAIDAGRMDRPRKTDTKSILTGLGLIVDGKLTNAAVVLYGKAGKLESIYPQYSIRVARFRGTDRLADFSDNRHNWGHAFDLLRRGEMFLKDHIPIAGKVSGKLKRDDQPLYHPRAMREALANAICHRDYTVAGASVSVAMYDDRLEIVNPGALRFGFTPEALYQPHESRPCNPLIANVFYRAGIIERWGTGTLNIIDWCRENGNPEPEWRVDVNSVAIVFYPVADKAGAQLEPRLEPQLESQPESLRNKVLRLLARGSLSKSEISRELGQKRASGQLNRVIKELLKEGAVAYTIPEKPQSPAQKYRLVKPLQQKDS
jgi:ATP-dependent DNA helicase RecG